MPVSKRKDSNEGVGEGPRCRRQKSTPSSSNRIARLGQIRVPKAIPTGRRVGIISDTHGKFDEQLYDKFRGVDEIWHAGDISGRNGTYESARLVVEKLAAIAPVKAVVRGNVDNFAGGLRGFPGFQANPSPSTTEHQITFPELVFIDIGGKSRAMVTHICGFPSCCPPRLDQQAFLSASAGQSRCELDLDGLQVPDHLKETFHSNLLAADAPVSVVVFGHSHVPGLASHQGVLWINPGSAGPGRFNLRRAVAVLDISATGDLSATIHYL